MHEQVGDFRWAVAGFIALGVLFSISQFTQDACAFALLSSIADVLAIKEMTPIRRDVLRDALGKIDNLVVHKPA